MLMEPDLTEDEAIKATILSRLDAVLLASEAESKGLTITRDEARALAERNKAVCEEDAEIEAECREYLEKMGLDYDEYWEEMVSVYQENHTALKAMDVLREEYQETAGQDGDGEEGQYLDWRILDSLRAETEIVWHDEDMKALFLEAQAARQVNLPHPDDLARCDHHPARLDEMKGLLDAEANTVDGPVNPCGRAGLHRVNAGL